MSNGIVLLPGEGEVLTDRAERTIAVLAGTDAIAVTETRYEAGEKGPEPHIHERHTDAFYVLEGEITFAFGAALERVRGGAGSFAAAPPRLVHTFGNAGPGRARYLNFHAPSEGFAEHLREIYRGDESTWFDQLDPPPDGGRAVADAVFLAPGAGETISVGGSSLVLKGTGDGTDGMFFLSETTVAPGFPGPPPHVHRQLHDLFYVLEGELTLRNGDATVGAPAGTFAYFPPGAVHTFTNERGAGPVRFLNFNTPAGWESYMRDLGAAYGDDRPPTREEIGAIASRYDFHVV